MKQDGSGPSHRPEDGFDRGWEGHRRRQARIGLALSPLQRLRWLEQTMEEMQCLLGRARAIGGALLKKGHRGDHPVDVLYGRLKLGRPVEEIVDEVRVPRPAKARPSRRRPGRPMK